MTPLGLDQAVLMPWGMERKQYPLHETQMDNEPYRCLVRDHRSDHLTLHYLEMHNNPPTSLVVLKSHLTKVSLRRQITRMERMFYSALYLNYNIGHISYCNDTNIFVSLQKVYHRGPILKQTSIGNVSHVARIMYALLCEHPDPVHPFDQMLILLVFASRLPDLYQARQGKNSPSPKWLILFALVQVSFNNRRTAQYVDRLFHCLCRNMQCTHSNVPFFRQIWPSRKGPYLGRHGHVLL